MAESAAAAQEEHVPKDENVEVVADIANVERKLQEILVELADTHPSVAVAGQNRGYTSYGQRRQLEMELCSMVESDARLAEGSKYSIMNDIADDDDDDDNDNDNGIEQKPRKRSLLYCVCKLRCPQAVVLQVFSANPAAASYDEDPQYPSALSVLVASSEIGLLSPALVGPIGEEAPDAYERSMVRPDIRCYSADIQTTTDETDPCPYPHLYQHLSSIRLFGRDPGNQKLLTLFRWFRDHRRINHIELTFRGYSDVSVGFSENDDGASTMAVTLSCRHISDIERLIQRKGLETTTGTISVVLFGREQVVQSDSGTVDLVNLINVLSLPEAPKVYRLGLSGINPHNPRNLEKAFDFLRQNPTVKKVSWSHSRLWNYKSDETATVLQGLSSLMNVEELTLYGCDFRDSLAAPLLQLLQSPSSSLVKLDVEHNKLSPEEAARILDVVGQKATLKSLRCDPASTEGFRLLLQHLKNHNSILQDFSFNGQKVGDVQTDGKEATLFIQQIQFYCFLNTLGRNMLRRDNLSKEQFFIALNEIRDNLDDTVRYGEFVSSSVEVLYVLLREDPACWAQA